MASLDALVVRHNRMAGAQSSAGPEEVDPERCHGQAGSARGLFQGVGPLDVNAVPGRSSRLHGGRASAGSRLQIQDLVNDRPWLLNSRLRAASASFHGWSVGDPQWVSPLAEDDYCEYQDGAFLAAVGLERLTSNLKSFWPRGGPVWDGLARIRSTSGKQGVLLVEAKSHTGENAGPGYACKAGESSLERITAQLETVKGALGVDSSVDWLADYYQHANRIAHLWFLHDRGVPAWLVYVYFLGDQAMHGPDDIHGWDAAMRETDAAIALPREHPLADRIVRIFPAAANAPI